MRNAVWRARCSSSSRWKAASFVKICRSAQYRIYRFDGGISEFADFLAPDAAITDTWRLTGTGTFTETVPVLQPGGAMVPTDVR
jgi:hypothetical protein